MPTAIDDAPKYPPKLRVVDGDDEPDEDEEMDERADLPLDWSDEEDGQLRRVIENARVILMQFSKWRGVLALDEFALRIVTLEAPPFDAGRDRGVAWTDADDTELTCWLSREFNLHLPTSVVAEAVRLVASKRPHHPVREYLRSVTWDGKPRLESWLTQYLGVEANAYSRNVGRWWLVSAVARAMKPGEKADHVLILEGAQGKGKSSALRALASAPWFDDTPTDLGTKDAYIALRGKWIVELAELESLTRAESNRAKAFFSKSVDNYRPPYGRQAVDVPRQCVFAGTGNLSEYLKDETGGRRYWSVRCGTIDVASLERDRDQIWAEALHAYKSGARWYPETDEEHAACADEQEQRYQVDTWETTIAHYVEKASVVTMAEVLHSALGIPHGEQTRAHQMRASAVLVDRLKWTRKRHMVQGERAYRYERPVPIPNVPQAAQAGRGNRKRGG